MAGSVGDIVQVHLRGQRGTAVWRLIFHYQMMDVPTPGYLTGLLTEFKTVVLTPLAATLGNVYTFVSLQALNIFSGDILEQTTFSPANGTRAGTTDTPLQEAAMYLLARANNRVRHGRKMLPIPFKSDMTDPTFAVAYTTLAATLANAIKTDLNPGTVDLMTPTIVGRVKYTTPLGRIAYRLPVSQAEMSDKFSPVVDCRLINRPTTMNTRKFWRGE